MNDVLKEFFQPEFDKLFKEELDARIDAEIAQLKAQLAAMKQSV